MGGQIISHLLVPGKEITCGQHPTAGKNIYQQEMELYCRVLGPTIRPFQNGIKVLVRFKPPKGGGRYNTSQVSITITSATMIIIQVRVTSLHTVEVYKYHS